MIIKKMLAISCLFLALPVCAMRRGMRVGVKASKLALTRAACSRSRHCFANKRALQTAAINRKRSKRKNKTFVSFGAPIDFVAKRLLCTEKKEDNKEELNLLKINEQELIGQMQKYGRSSERWKLIAQVLAIPPGSAIAVIALVLSVGVVNIIIGGIPTDNTVQVEQSYFGLANFVGRLALFSAPAAGAFLRSFKQYEKKIAAQEELAKYRKQIATQKVDHTK